MVYSLLIITARYHNKRSIPCRKEISKKLARLARNLLSKMCAGLVQHLKKIIISEEFVDKHRQSKSDFTRKRKLPFHLLIAFLINFVRGSYQDELDKFFKTLHRFDVAKRIVSKAALTKARMKLKYEAFCELNQKLVEYFYSHFKPPTWYTFRLLAVDASLTRLPIIEAIDEHFGAWTVHKGTNSPMARISQLFDVLSKISLDAIISPKSDGERELAAQHMLKLMPNDLVLLDRGYPAWWLFSSILSAQANFCARISCTKWKAVRKFFHSGRAEKTISLPAFPTSVAKCSQLGLDLTPLTLRLIRIEREGKVQILITSLLDIEKYPTEIFADLYHSRWPIEEDYKAIKCRMELENFTGKSPLSVYQDFHAKVFAKNLVSVMAFPVNQALQATRKMLTYQYQINFTQALSKSKGVLALLLYETGVKIQRLIAQCQELFQSALEPIRPGRKYPRNHKTKLRIFFPQYKPIG